MLMIPKTPLTSRKQPNYKIRQEDPPKFRLSDSSTSSLSSLNSFFADILQPERKKNNVPEATRRIDMSIHEERHSTKNPSTNSVIENDTRRDIANENSLTQSSTICINDSHDFEFDKSDASLHQESQSPPPANVFQQSKRRTLLLDQSGSDSEADDYMPPRPHSEPLFTSTPSVQPPRPPSADVHVQGVKNKRPHNMKNATICITPRCARPTKAWLARVEPKRETPSKAKLPKPRPILMNTGRKEVWERLWAQKTDLHSKEHE